MASILLGTDGPKKKLQRVNQFLRTTKALEIAGEHLLNKTAIAFRLGRDPVTGRAWKPLKPNTIIGRRKRTSRPLLDRGILRASFQRGGRSNIWRFRGDELLAIGSSQMTAVWHQIGTKGGPENSYKIRPKRRKSLRFPIAAKTGTKRKAGGFWAFAKEITHPGLPSRRMLGASKLDAIKVAGILKKHVDKRLER